jgi:mono/diheme cytochrome c family protein
MFKRLLIIGAMAPAFAVFASEAQIERVPPTPTSPASGKEMFDQYCAVCHGKDGRGGGPASSALKKAPADLTQLTTKNSGKFPELKVFQTIQGDSEVPSHGSRDMPMWGLVFRSMSHDKGEITHMRVANLTDYVKSLQRK